MAEPGQRREVQDLVPKGCVGSNPTPRTTITNSFSNIEAVLAGIEGKANMPAKIKGYEWL